jgi:hypothetical protein
MTALEAALTTLASRQAPPEPMSPKLAELLRQAITDGLTHAYVHHDDLGYYDRDYLEYYHYKCRTRNKSNFTKISWTHLLPLATAYRTLNEHISNSFPNG